MSRGTGKDSAPKETTEAPEGANWFGIIITSTPLLLIGVHLIWPQIIVIRYLANFTILLFASLILSGIPAHLQGEKEFILHWGWTMIVLLTGFSLFYFYGWISTIWVLVTYALINIRYGYILPGPQTKKSADISYRVISLPTIGWFDFLLFPGIVFLYVYMFRKHGSLSTAVILSGSAVLCLFFWLLARSRRKPN